MRAVILAGGAGARLRPYTATIPKPLVPIGGEKPILEIVLRQLARAGCARATLAVGGGSASLVRAFFGDGEAVGVPLDYVVDASPLGTVGPLTLIEDLPSHVLVMNGDVLSDLDLRAFYEAHVARGAAATVAACYRSVRVDFGVMGCDEHGVLVEFSEKPSHDVLVSMGIYCLRCEALACVPRGTPYGFDDLMRDGIRRGDRIDVVRHDGFWLDIGRPEDYDRANELYPALRDRLDPA